MEKEKKYKEEIIKDLKESILINFIETEYKESDRLHVSMHEEVDNWASSLSFESALDFLSQFDSSDFSTLDTGLYDGVLEKDGFKKLVIVLAYCLAEQELYNDDVLNDCQSWGDFTKDNEKQSNELIEKAKEELEKIKKK